MSQEQDPSPSTLGKLLEPLKQIQRGGILAFFTRKERLATIGILATTLLVLTLLTVPLITQPTTETSPPAPQAINDTSGDGLADVVNVFVYGSNPLVNDTSEDGIPDAWKAQHAQWDETFRTWRPHPARDDAHLDLTGDGLTLLEEYEHGTDPHKADTSGDGFTDGWLVRSGLDPLTRHDPEHVCSPDGMTLEEKYAYYEGPENELLACEEDSSGNGLPDQAATQGEWVINGRTHTFEPTDPTAVSTGGSGVPDGWLIYHGLDPHKSDHRYEDIAQNGLSTLEAWEWMQDNNQTSIQDWDDALDPTAFSSVGHGIPDGWLIRHGLDPLDAQLADQHLTESGLTVREEYEHGTDPHKADTSGDGLTDGECVQGWPITVDEEEQWVQCNPLVTDSSGDGLPDKAQKEGVFEIDGRIIEFPPTNPMSTDTDGDGISDIDTITAMPPGMPQLDPTKSDTSGSGLLDGEEWDLFHEAAERARTDVIYAELVANEQGVDPSEAPDLLEPWGDLSGDGTPNVITQDAIGDGLTDGEQVHPPTRDGRQLPISDPTLTDSDGDELPDAWELEHTRYDTELGGWLLDPMRADSTGNGIPDAEEDYATGCFSDPSLEGNGIPWEDEPFPNRLEMEHGTDPFECDTIGDGLPDGWTVFMNERLQEAGIDLSLSPTVMDSMDDGTQDGDRVSPVTYDGNGRVNMIDQDPECPEPNGKTVCLWRWGTPNDPLDKTLQDLGDLVDLRGDCGARERCTVVLQLTLADEVNLQTDPSTPDTSGDGFQDAWKALHRFDATNPDVPEPNDDLDGDGLTTWQEYLIGSDPLDADTDKGGVPDGPDHDPLDPTTDDGDCDWDGILDREEARSDTTDAGTSDTSGDGILDGRFNPRGCETVDGFLTPKIGVDIVAIPNENEDGFTLLGAEDTGTDPSTWDSSGDRLPDGWKALYDLNPLTQHSPQLDMSGDGISLIEAYTLGRPAWWDEDEHGAWWFGADPTIENTRDLDGDGLDDTLFDPEPLSPTNDCQLPTHWDLPPAWDDHGEPFCLATEPPQEHLQTLRKGLRQLAYTHAMNTTQTPEQARQAADASPRETIRATSLSIDEDLHTHRAFNATVDLCKVHDDGCTTPSTLHPPGVGVYVSTRSIGDTPDPREDVLLCILDEHDAWTAKGECTLDPGTRQAPSQDSGLLLAPHTHGFVQPGETWEVQPGDVIPGRQATINAWPLPTEHDAILAPEVAPQDNPPPQTRQPIDAQAVIHIPEDLVLLRGEPKEVTFQATDLVGHPLQDHRVDIAWKGEQKDAQRTTEDGRFTLELDPGEPDAPLVESLELDARTLSGIQGTTVAVDVPVQIPTSLTIQNREQDPQGGLRVNATLTDHQGNPVTGQPLTAQLAVETQQPAQTTHPTGPNGDATLILETPPDAQPRQAPLLVQFEGSNAWAPSKWQGRTNVIVEANVTLDVPSPISAIEGATVEAGLFLPSGDPLIPAPGDPVNVTVTIAGERVQNTFTNPLPQGTTTIPVPGGASMNLGHQTATINAVSGTFVRGTEHTTPVQVTSPSRVTVLPDRVGAGVENPLEVTVTDVWERGLEGATVEIRLDDAIASGRTDETGTTTVPLEVPLNTERGERPLSVSVGPTNASEPLDVDLPVLVVMGTLIETPTQAQGSLDTVELTGTLETARGHPIPHQPLQIEAFGQDHEVQVDSDGHFALELLPPNGTRPGIYEATLSFEATGELAASTTDVALMLKAPTRFDVAAPDAGAMGQPLGIEGRLLTDAGEPVPEGNVTMRLAGRSHNATVDEEGFFSAQLDTDGLEPGEHALRLAYNGAPGYAPSQTQLTVELRQEVRLITQQRTDHEGISLSVQAVREDGEPLPNAELAVMTPEPFLVTTDEEGVARIPFKHDVLDPGTELDIRYLGDNVHAATQTSVEIASPPLLPPGEDLLLTSLLILLVAVEAVIIWRALKRRRMVEDVLRAVEDARHRLHVGDEVSAAILSSYHRLRSGIEAAGWDEEHHHTHREFLIQVFDEMQISTKHLGPFVELVDRAQYDPEPIRAEERTRALHLASELAGELRRILGQGGATP